MNATDVRQPDYDIDRRFVERWSPRAFDESAITRDELLPILEAARWAPSSFNAQPWRFLYALRGTSDWDMFLGLLVPMNQSWAKGSGALIFVVSDTMTTPPQGGDLRPSHSHSFDAGAAWAQLALQASAMGLYTHGMIGVDFDSARNALAVPERFRMEAAIAVGRIGDPATLPEQMRAREAPNQRRPLSESAFEGKFPQP